MRLRTTAWGVFVGLALVMPVSRAAAAGCENLAAQVAAAKTAADHEAIAACYDAEAKRARARGVADKQLAASYLGPGLVPMLDQATALAKAREREAEQYEALAASHREMAYAAKEPPDEAGAEPAPVEPPGAEAP